MINEFPTRPICILYYIYYALYCIEFPKRILHVLYDQRVLSNLFNYYNMIIRYYRYEYL